MAVPGSGTAPLNNPDHRAEHDRIIPSLDKGPRGIVAYQLGSAAGLSIAGSWVAIYGVYNTQLFAGRMYLLAFATRAIYIGTAGSFRFTINQSPSPIPRTSLVVDAYQYNFAGAWDSFCWEQTFTVDTDMVITSLEVTATAPAGSQIWLELGGHMRIEDIGAVDPVGRIW
jgi:hypothetical protein